MSRLYMTTDNVIYFGPYRVTEQVFLRTKYSFALVNLKPLAPGHVLVCPLEPHKRLTDLSPNETTDLFSTVQRTQRMLSLIYHAQTTSSDGGDGSFTVAVQDGPEAGQTVPHVHVHVIPRGGKENERGGDAGDEIYTRMASEEGNVGGALWDAKQRPVPGGGMPRVEDSERVARMEEEMHAEAAKYREVLDGMARGFSFSPEGSHVEARQGMLKFRW